VKIICENNLLDYPRNEIGGDRRKFGKVLDF